MSTDRIFGWDLPPGCSHRDIDALCGDLPAARPMPAGCCALCWRETGGFEPSTRPDGFCAECGATADVLAGVL